MTSDVDIDAQALPARPFIQDDVPCSQTGPFDDRSIVSGNSESEIKQRDLALETPEELHLPPHPPDEWSFSQMVQEIARRISGDELEEIKEMFRGPGGIGKKTRDECKKCITLFGVLRENMFISPIDLLYLFKILHVLQRSDLLDIAVEYCRKRGNILHYFNSSAVTEEGYESVKIHVEGRDFSNCTPEFINRLRHVVAMVVCAPPEVIRIAGIEPGSSLLVTLMLPRLYTTALFNLLKRRRSICELRDIGVDIISLKDQVFSIRDTPAPEMSETEQQKKMRNVYEQLRERSKALENSNLHSRQLSKEIDILDIKFRNQDLRFRELQAEYIKLSEEYKTLEERCLKRQMTIETLQKMHQIPYDGRKACTDLQASLDESEKANIPIPYIRTLLRHNTELVASYWKLKNTNDLRRLEMAVSNKREMIQLYSQMLFTGELSAESWLFQHYSRCLIGQTLSINTSVVHDLKVVSNHLNDEERAILTARYYWEDDDVVKICTDVDRGLFLVGIECKEAEMTQTQVNTESFMTRMLESIDRPDLIKIIEAIMEKRKRQILVESTEAQIIDGIGQVNAFASLIIGLIEIYARHLLAKNSLRSTRLRHSSTEQLDRI